MAGINLAPLELLFSHPIGILFVKDQINIIKFEWIVLLLLLKPLRIIYLNSTIQPLDLLSNSPHHPHHLDTLRLSLVRFSTIIQP